MRCVNVLFRHYEGSKVLEVKGYLTGTNNGRPQGCCMDIVIGAGWGGETLLSVFVRVNIYAHIYIET